MRVSCSPSASGSTYRIHRSGDDFVDQLRRLMPLLEPERYDILIGGADDASDVVLTITPRDPATDAEFRRQVLPTLDA